MPSFGLIAAISWLVLMTIVCVLQFGRFVPLKGLTVHILRPGAPSQSSPWIEPLRVRVEFAGQSARPNLYLNSQPISWEDFGTVLAKELNRRPPHFPVYVEGDRDLEWRQVVKAIDIVRGLQAEVVMLTTATESPRKQSGLRTTPNPAKTSQPSRR
jgi:biopolymer transport protein ExbD